MNVMTNLAIRDQVEDHLLTPKNCALVVIDYQPIQVGSVASMDRRELVTNIVAVFPTAELYRRPLVLSTGDRQTGPHQPPIPPIAAQRGGLRRNDPTHH